MSSLNLEDSNPESSLTSTTSLIYPSSSSSPSSASTTIKPKQEILRAHPYHYKVHENQRFFMEITGMLANWEPSREIWPLRYGSTLLGIASTLSASYVNWHFRETLVLLNYTRWASYAAMFLVPGVIGGVTHFTFVTAPLITESNKCGICLQFRALGLQGLSSILYPFVLVPITAYPVAKRLKNYSVPVLNLKNPWPVVQFTREVLRPIKGNMWAITAAQVLLAGIVTYQEQATYFETVLPKLKITKNYFSNMFPRPEPQ